MIDDNIKLFPIQRKIYLDILKKSLEHTLPCAHIGCYSHISHPCEGCNRYQGELPELEQKIIRAMIKRIEFPEPVYTKYTRFEIMDI